MHWLAFLFLAFMACACIENSLPLSEWLYALTTSSDHEYSRSSRISRLIHRLGNSRVFNYPYTDASYWILDNVFLWSSILNGHEEVWNYGSSVYLFLSTYSFLYTLHNVFSYPFTINDSMHILNVDIQPSTNITITISCMVHSLQLDNHSAKIFLASSLLFMFLKVMLYLLA